MYSLLRLLLRILSIVVFSLALAPNSHAQKQIGVIMTGDISYYGVLHENFVAEINKRFAGTEKIEIILQKPFPDSISWSNAARKLIAFDVDLIVTYGFPATAAVIHENSSIPLVYAGVYEPDRTVLTGKNVTGCGFKVPMSSIIRYFKGLKPVNALGIIYSGVEADSIRQYETMKELAEGQNIKTEKVDVRVRADLDTLKTKNLDAVFITGSSLAHIWLDDVLSILIKGHVPTADIFPDYAEVGVVMTLFQPPHLQGLKAADMVSQILGGEKPGNISSHTSRDTEMVLNLAEARHLGITFPIQLLIGATRVIE